MTEILLEVKNLKKHFPIKAGLFSKVVGQVYAVDGIDLQVKQGQVLGVVGESGCGKTTAGKTILKLIEPTDGEIWFKSQNITHFKRTKMTPLRRDIQIIFQDPYSSLNPRLTVGAIVAAPLEIHNVVHGTEKENRVSELLRKVGLGPDAIRRYPHEFSGGQRQRIGIARALALDPDLIVGDEPVSALDVSIQAQIINLLKDLQNELGLTYIMIAHDLSVISHICDHVAVMYLGKIVETAPRDMLYFNPQHPYTRALLSAVPIPDPGEKKQRILLEGDVPSPIEPPSGCRFHPRCPEKIKACAGKEPDFVHVETDHMVACHLIKTGGSSPD